MSYTHEIYAGQGFLFINHSRVTQLPSGVLTVRPLGQSGVEYERTLPTFSSLAVPQGLGPAPVVELPTIPSATIECADLDEMVATGRKRWQTIVTNMQNVVRVTMAFAVLPPAAPTSPNGLILPASYALGEPDIAVNLASPDEMDALQRMVDGVNDTLSVQQPSVSGQYL